MKREIKFRGIRIDNNQWVYGGYHLHNEVMLCIASKEQHDTNKKHVIVCDGMSDWNLPVPINCYEVIPESVGEFTGLKDKNGKEIYEGGICKSLKGLFVVEYMNAGFSLRSLNKKCRNWAFTQHSAKSIEVIGNIYENEDLIKWQRF